VRTISTDWKEYGIAPPVEHHSECLARHIDRLPHHEKNGSTIVYHDPCYLGRYRGKYDEPREVVSAYASQLLEPARTRERSFCCGAGGGLVSRRGKGQEGERRARRAVSCHWSGCYSRRVPFLQHHVLGRAPQHLAGPTAAARYRPTRRWRAPSPRGSRRVIRLKDREDSLQTRAQSELRPQLAASVSHAQAAGPESRPYSPRTRSRRSPPGLPSRAERSRQLENILHTRESPMTLEADSQRSVSVMPRT
jgi:hypothetical protein